MHPHPVVMAKRWRAKCPESFTSEAALQCLQEARAGLACKLEAARQGGHVFSYNFGSAAPDRQALHEYQDTIRIFLMKNSSGIFKKSVMAAAFTHWNAMVDNVFTNNRPKYYLNDQVYALVSMFHAVKTIRKGVRKGSKLPAWLMDLVMMLDVPTPSEQESEHSQGSEEESKDAEDSQEESQSTGAQCSKELPLVPMHELKHAFYKNTSPRSRPVLRRVSIASSSDDIPLPAHAGNTPTKDQVDPIKDQEVKKVFWYDPIDNCGKCLASDGMVTASTKVEMHESGFACFTWDDGKQWVSEEPFLKIPVLKKPASMDTKIMDTNTMETHFKEKKSSDAKIAFSRAYHKAEREYNKQCEANNEVKDIVKRRRLARAAGKAAAEALQA
eukprot:3105451-Lingulodinium_polyedra.AAC.1